MKNALLSISLMALMTTTSKPIHAAPFDRVAEKNRMLQIETVDRTQTLNLVGLESADEKTKAFLEFYKNHIWPQEQTLKNLGIHMSIVNVMVDRALYDNEEESKKWIDDVVKTESEINEISNSAAWKAAIAEWARLAEGLTGELADHARKLGEDIKISAFSEDMIPTLNRVSELSAAIQNKANTVPAAALRESAEEKIIEASSRYLKGELNLSQATSAIQEAELNGDIKFGNELQAAAGDALNEAAVLRTNLARSKGFRSWAEYQNAVGKKAYAESLQSVENQIHFMEEILRLTRPAFDHFLSVRRTEMGLESHLPWTNAQIDFLTKLPDDALVAPYFPKEEGEGRWRQAMEESGYSPDLLNNIHLDSLPRANKMGHGGYMAPLTVLTAKTLSIDSSTLTVDTGSDFYPAAIEIVQNLRSDGAEGHITAYHEGGHALHYSTENNPLGVGSAYGYVEVHSMTMEHFLTDISHITRTAKDRNGNAIPRDLAQEFIENYSINELLQLRMLATRSLFDLKLWNTEYLAAEQNNGYGSYVATSKRLYEQLFSEHMAYEAAPTPEYDWSAYSFVRPHFRSAEVQYSGYVFALMASTLTAEALLDRLETATGKRSLDQQYSIASHLIPFYERGFATPFPQSVENFTGKQFSVADFTAKISEKPLAYGTENCSKTLKNAKRQ